MIQSRRLTFRLSITTIVAVACSAWLVLAEGPPKLSAVISIDHLEAELIEKTSEIAQTLASPETFHESTGKRRLWAAQLAVVSQALAQHDQDSKHQPAASLLRDAAFQIGRATTFEEAQSALANLKMAIEGKRSTDVTIEYDWAKLAKTRTLMDSLRERTDLVRKALRRSKDPDVESRHAEMMAILALAVEAHAGDLKDPADRELWREYSVDFQREMIRTATALKSQDKPAILEHFAAAQAACDHCHEKFKR